MSAINLFVEKDQQTSDDFVKDRKDVINLLDYDSLAKIFMLLPIPERMNMQKVCTKWKEACQLAWWDIKKYKCESSIERCYDNCLLTQSYLEQLLLRCGNYLKELSLSDVCHSNIMPFVGNHCQNLTSLECIFDANSLTDNAHHFVQAFTQLDQLKFIKITVNHKWTHKAIDLSAIVNSLPKNINEIHLVSKYLKEKKRIAFMTFKKFKNLKKLTLHGLWSKNIPQEIAEMTTLAHLNLRLYDVPKVILDYYHPMVTPARRLSETDELSTEELNTIFCKCKNLKHLDISIGGYELVKIPLQEWSNFENLEYLGITCNIKLGLANTIVKNYKNLKQLKIYCPKFINDESALIKLTELSNLECLILLGLSKINEELITAISNNCKKLKCLEIPCRGINNYYYRYFHPFNFDNLSTLQYLEDLNLSHSNNLKDSTIIAVANECKNLKSLNITGCELITETALVALANLESLEKLNVGCLHIMTDTVLIKFKGLKELDCYGCKKLTSSGIIQYIKKNPDLRYICVVHTTNFTIDFALAADQVTKNRTNGIILYMKLFVSPITDVFNSLLESQWLVIDNI